MYNIGIIKAYNDLQIRRTQILKESINQDDFNNKVLNDITLNQLYETADKSIEGWNN